MSDKTGKGLAEYAKAQLGRPYWWGTYGQIATAELLAGKRRQYPDNYQSTAKPAFDTQFGQRVHDCVGLIKGYLWSDGPNDPPHYNRNQDVAVRGLYNVCDRKGDINTLPDIPGVCVFYSNLGHVGVYIGNNEVVEARGHAYGVVKSKAKGGSWAMWGMPRWIDYTADGNSDMPTPSPEPEPQAKGPTCEVQLPVLKMGSHGEAVRMLQTMLIAKGFSCGFCGADGDFGSGTKSAVLKFQRAHGLEADGVVGEKTWAAVISG